MKETPKNGREEARKERTTRRNNEGITGEVQLGELLIIAVPCYHDLPLERVCIPTASEATYPCLLHYCNPPSPHLVAAAYMSTTRFTYSYARAYMRFCL
jgi:hypothetical protein